MMRAALLSCLLIGASCASPLTWTVDNLKSIGGHAPRVEGSPKVVETDRGNAVQFDGVDDGLEIPALPLAGEREFTLEILFRPDPDGPEEQRFLHLQEDASPSRFLIETRVRPDGTWHLDTYIETEVDNGKLIDPRKAHPTGSWYTAALTYDGRTMRHYVNGREELSRDLKFRPLTQGKTSIGMRINRVFWFKGAIRTVRFTPRGLPPADLLRP
jgi:hypothetical protein